MPASRSGLGPYRVGSVHDRCTVHAWRLSGVCVRECLCHGSRIARWPRLRSIRELQTHVPM